MRILILLLAVSGLVARASDPIAAPVAGASATVTQPHVTAQLIPETTLITAGKPFDVILHLHSDPGWHTYWINPGDAGLATEIKWTLPPGFTAGPIQWPTPEKHDMGPLITYGYGGDVYLITTITVPDSPGTKGTDVEIKAKASWLVCKEECIPGKGEFSLKLPFAGHSVIGLDREGENKELFAQARARLPVPVTGWHVLASYYPDPKPTRLTLLFKLEDQNGISLSRSIFFFPEQSNVLSGQASDNSPAVQTDKPVGDGRARWFRIGIALQQNGETPDKMSGVLVSDQPLLGNAKSVYISEFPITRDDAMGMPVHVEGPALVTGTAVPDGTAPAQGPASATLPSAVQSQPANANADTAEPVARSATATGAAPPPGTAAATLLTLGGVLGAAFVGGLILNLMPCVLPVLSLKVFSLMKHAGENPKAAWVQGAAFTAGVVLSFWVLAGLLLALRSAGNHLGWGFQMQSPGFVLGLIFLFFLLGLNLFGVFELGSSLVGLDAKATNHLGGLASSFGNGALATLAATPCTAPFMGSALGFAAQQPGYISMLIFTFLALGMASPYLLLTIFPGALRFVPKPGAWMEAFKQFMGFLLMATVIFLVYVFGALVGEEQVPWLLFVLLLAGIAAWIYGRWFTPTRSTGVRMVAFVLASGLLGYAVSWGMTLAKDKPVTSKTEETMVNWQPWKQETVEDDLARGRPVFVDFTAAWCLSCKVNEQLALDTDAVKRAFNNKRVALFRADWTHADPAISQTLQKFNRDGVPLYLLFSPKDKDHPQVLPAVLTPGIVLDAIEKL
jgi:thiol:disulfide interchange protein/DsbC/DsbD-like thiol-disulfide interchange protein